MKYIGGICVVGAAVATLLAGCAPRKVVPVSSPERQSGYDVRSEGTFPPAGADSTVESPDVDETPIASDTLYVEDSAPPVPAPPVVAPVDTVPGFRVQLFATANRTVAERARAAAEKRLGLTAYVQFVDGLYKVRAGDCTSRSCAEDLLKRCRASVYRDAWIVPCAVRRDRSKPASGGGHRG